MSWPKFTLTALLIAVVVAALWTTYIQSPSAKFNTSVASAAQVETQAGPSARPDANRDCVMSIQQAALAAGSGLPLGSCKVVWQIGAWGSINMITPGALPAERQPAAAQTLVITPTAGNVNLRQEPNGPVVGTIRAGETVQVLDSYTEAVAKIGVRDTWVRVQAQDGTEGYTAAWLYTVVDTGGPEMGAPTPRVSASPGTAPEATTAALYLMPANDAARIRVAPVDGPVVYVAARGEVVKVIEPADKAATKIGQRGAWVQVQTQDGTVGYTAAWLYTVTAAPAPVSAPSSPAPVLLASTAGTVKTAANAADNDRLTLVATGDNTRIRTAPVTGQIVGVVARGEIVEVIEPAKQATAKIGQRDAWVQVRTQDGIEGYTAAWLYTINNADIFAPASAGIPPLGADGTTQGAPSGSLAGTSTADSPNSIAALNIGPSKNDDSTGSTGQLVPPASSSILALNVPETTTRPGTVEAPTGDTAEPVSEQAGEPSVPETQVELAGNIAPISVAVTDGTAVEIAELALNGRRLALFTAPPYAYDLDTNLLIAGDYKLTFTTISPDGIIRADDLYFEIAVEELPVLSATETGADGVAVQTAESGTEADESALAPARRVVLVEGEPRPLLLEFSAEDGLTPAALETGADNLAEETPDSLMDILGKPFTSVIPAPFRDALTAQRPTLSALIIAFMLIVLVPQGLFTLYWMTYTWNNPQVADAYRSPREFAEPQYSFTALLPARREEGVIRDTILAVDRINYPDHLKEILILIRDEDDDGTIAAAQGAIDEIGKDNIRLVTFTDGPRNKPNGLNKGLRLASRDVICVFDAEDEPHPDIYNIVNTVMVRDGADVVQSGVQLMNFRSTWFSAFNVLEYFFWFKSGLHAFTRRFHVTPLGGNTVFFKRFWLERIGGWDDQCLTEDADVGLRLTQLGAKIQIVYDEQHATQEETPDTVDSFIKQRTRWCQGFYQIFFKGDWRKLSTLTQQIIALYILLNSLFQAANIFFIPAGLYIALTQKVAVPIALLSYIPIYILILQMIINLIGIREFTSAYREKLPLFFTLRMMVYYYPYQLLLSAAAIRAVYRFATQKKGWEKTAHSNLHRQAQQLKQVGA